MLLLNVKNKRKREHELVSKVEVSSEGCSVQQCAVCVVHHSLVVSSVQIKQAPPSLRCTVQHRENTDKRGELAGCGRTPLLHHQLGGVLRLPRRLGPVLGPPVARGEECAAAFERGAVKSHGDDHQQARRHREGVSGAVGQQQSPVQLHVRNEMKTTLCRFHAVMKRPPASAQPALFLCNGPRWRAFNYRAETGPSRRLREEEQTQRSHSTEISRTHRAKGR